MVRRLGTALFLKRNGRAVRGSGGNAPARGGSLVLSGAAAGAVGFAGCRSHSFMGINFRIKHSPYIFVRKYPVKIMYNIF